MPISLTDLTGSVVNYATSPRKLTEKVNKAKLLLVLNFHCSTLFPKRGTSFEKTT